jgi:hypothetical protein
MRRCKSLLAAICFVAACDNPTQPAVPPAEVFGSVTATVDGRSWTSSVFPDSTIGFYSHSLERFQITGQEVRSGGWPTLTVFLHASPIPGAYSIGAAGASAVA